MKTEWAAYYDELGLEGLFRDRAMEILAFYEPLFPGIEDVFVTDYIDKENVRQYENLWLFSPTLVFEAKKFLTDDDFDGATFSGKVSRWNVKKNEYNFIKATTKSKMVLEVFLTPGALCSLKATRENCDRLRQVFLKYFLPNITK